MIVDMKLANKNIKDTVWHRKVFADLLIYTYLHYYCNFREAGEQMVTIRVETLNRDRQMEEVEIQVPVTVYRNMDPEQLPAPGPATRDRGFVRSCGKRSSLAAKLRQLMLR